MLERGVLSPLYFLQKFYTNLLNSITITYAKTPFPGFGFQVYPCPAE
jgi:hypothetical protein